MPASNALLAGVVTPQVTTQTNATCTVTVTAPSVVSSTLYLNGVIISASAAPATAVEATITGVSGVTIPIEIPAAAFAPIAFGFGAHPIRCAPGTNLVVSVPALGVGVVCSVAVFYQKGVA